MVHHTLRELKSHPPEVSPPPQRAQGWRLPAVALLLLTAVSPVHADGAADGGSAGAPAEASALGRRQAVPEPDAARAGVPALAPSRFDAAPQREMPATDGTTGALAIVPEWSGLVAAIVAAFGFMLRRLRIGD
jgi:hypothetical protein